MVDQENAVFRYIRARLLCITISLSHLLSPCASQLHSSSLPYLIFFLSIFSPYQETVTQRDNFVKMAPLTKIGCYEVYNRDDEPASPATDWLELQLVDWVPTRAVDWTVT